MPMTYMAPFNLGFISKSVQWCPERERQRQTDRQTDRQIQRHTERDRQIQRHRVLRQKPHNACLYC